MVVAKMQPASRDFHHPFKPYNIQLEFMTALYDCIDQRQVGIFESPTGTVGPLLPYDSFSRLRLAVFDALHDSNLSWRDSIFYGTSLTLEVQGKSLSLICGALTWLRDREVTAIDTKIAAENGGLFHRSHGFY